MRSVILTGLLILGLVCVLAVLGGAGWIYSRPVARVDVAEPVAEPVVEPQAPVPPMRAFRMGRMNYQLKELWNVAFGQPQERFVDIASGPQGIYVLITVPDYPVIRVYVRIYSPENGDHLRDIELETDTICNLPPTSVFDVREDGSVIATSSAYIDGASVYYVDRYDGDGNRVARTPIPYSVASIHRVQGDNRLLITSGSDYLRLAPDFTTDYTGAGITPPPFAVAMASTNIVRDISEGLYAEIALCEEDGTVIRVYQRLAGHSTVTGCADGTRCYATVRYPYSEYRTRVYVSELKEGGADQLFDDIIGSAPFSQIAVRGQVVYTLNPDTGDVHKYVDIDQRRRLPSVNGMRGGGAVNRRGGVK